MAYENLWLPEVRQTHWVVETSRKITARRAIEHDPALIAEAWQLLAQSGESVFKR
jgi:hypothetical protein